MQKKEKIEWQGREGWGDQCFVMDAMLNHLFYNFHYMPCYIHSWKVVAGHLQALESWNEQEGWLNLSNKRGEN